MAKSNKQLRKELKEKKKAKKEQAFQKKPMWLLLAVVLTLIAYSSIGDNQYLNYDDDVYVTENPPLRNIEVGTLFSEFYLNQYSPLAMTIMGMEFKVSDANPKFIRFVSVLLHLACVLLVFLVFRLLLRDDFKAAMIALLFGVHPMQVESVAWLAASMKISSYSLFFLLSIWWYIKAELAGNKKLFWFAFIAFLASAFCKEQAVVLPMVLIAVDYLRGKDIFIKSVWISKLPFFVVALIFGLITLKASSSSELVQKVYDFGLTDRIVFATYSVGMYIQKLLIPADLSFFYTYPIKGSVPGYFYLFPLVLIGIIYALFAAYKKENRLLVFGIAFFLFNIVLTTLTAVMSVRDVIMADRYVYLASIGVFLILVSLLDKFKSKSSFAPYVSVGLGLVFMIVSMGRVPVFATSIAVFTDVIEKESYSDKRNPYLSLPYNNRGIEYKRAKQFDKAMADFEEAIASNANYPSAYLNRGNIAFDAGDDAKAKVDYDKVLSLEPSNTKALSARGAIYAKRKEYDSAIEDLTKAISSDKYFIDAYSNRALTYLDMGKLDEAIADCTTIIQINGTKDDMFEFRGYLRAQNSEFDLAIQDFNRAIQINPRNDSYYFNRSTSYRAKGNMSSALQDAKKAKSLGYKVSEEYLNSLR